MRFLIVLLIVAGIGWWVWDMCHSGFHVPFVGAGIKKLTVATNTGMGTAALGSAGLSPGASPGGAPGASGNFTAVNSTTVPIAPGFRPAAPVQQVESKATRIYRFQHRPAPAAADLTICGAVACTATTDTASQTVCVVGPVEGVELVRKYLESVDCQLGSCAVEAWAVFVDKSAQHGFDLVAAIRAATGAGVDLTGSVLGGGALTLNVSAGDVAAALNVICDGSVVEVVQRPHVQLMQGVVSHVESLQQVPIPTTSVSQGIAQTSIEYRKVGLQMDVTPNFLGGNQLMLGVVQTNGLIGQTVKIDSNEIPVIQSQTVSTTVQLVIGQTVVLGGVSTLRERTAKGLLHDTKEVSQGTLYVVASTYLDIPKARIVGALDVPPDAELPRMADPSEWIDKEIFPVLPCKPVRPSLGRK